MCKRHTICNGQLRTKVGDHSTNMMFMATEMKTSFAAFAISFSTALPLHKQFAQRHVARGKYSKVAMQRHYPFVLLQCHGSAYGNSFLTNAAKPFADATLPQQYQHLFLDKARQQ